MNLIFGGSGFVGQHLIAKLATEYQVYDITKSKNNFHYVLIIIVFCIKIAFKW